VSILDQTAPAALHSLLTRLLDDHQRMHPHHAHLCPLCQDTERAIQLLAEHLPDEDCSTYCAPPGEPHADTCPGKDGNCPGCAAAPGTDHLSYCPRRRTNHVFHPGVISASDTQ
jgi:hypothetical protein